MQYVQKKIMDFWLSCVLDASKREQPVQVECARHAVRRPGEIAVL
jgi:hypothetical protein